jgi:UDP-N-acetylmuramate: L-alanyl-gamma-D-glutamyl-meso-diaminopimelate ligase
LANANLAICHAGGLDWNAAEALAELGPRAHVTATVDDTVAQVKALIQPGDQILCMSNGGFGGIHEKLLSALQK